MCSPWGRSWVSPSTYLGPMRSSKNISEQTNSNYKSQDSHIITVFEFDIFQTYFFNIFSLNELQLCLSNLSFDLDIPVLGIYTNKMKSVYERGL